MIFGSYEADRQLKSTALETLWTARPHGGKAKGPAAYAVNCFQPPAIWDEKRKTAAVEAFLDRARCQQSLRGPKSHWAVVHEVGKAELGAYYVTDLYGTAASRLIEGQIDVDGPLLYRIVSSVIDGLIELRDKASRPHGNLIPRNILIGGKGP